MAKLKTFTYCEINGNASIFFDAYTKKEASQKLKELVKYPDGWRYEGSESTYSDSSTGFSSVSMYTY